MLPKLDLNDRINKIQQELEMYDNKWSQAIPIIAKSYIVNLAADILEYSLKTQKEDDFDNSKSILSEVYEMLELFNNYPDHHDEYFIICNGEKILNSSFSKNQN